MRNRKRRQGVTDPKILLVDDDPVIREVVAEELSSKGYEVTRAQDGLEAWERFQEGSFDVAICDLALPKIDGHHLVRLLRQHPQGHALPVIAFSALAPRDIAKLPGLSVDAYVAKGPPTVVVDNLLEAIQLVLNKDAQRRKMAIFGYETTQPRQIVSELLALQMHDRNVIAALAEIVIELDPQGQILIANQGALRLFARAQTEVIGRPFTEFLAPQDRPVFERLLDRLRKDLLSAETLELVLGGARRRLRCARVADSSTLIAVLVTAEA